MIEQLMIEIQELERVLINKKMTLVKLQEEKLYANTNQFIAIVEMRDQFYYIDSISLVSDDNVSVQKFLEDYSKNWCSSYVFKFYKVEDLKEEFSYLKQIFSYQSDNDIIYDWMNDHEAQLIQTHEG